MGIAQFEGRALVFNNGVIDVRQGDTSLVDSEKVAHIPESNVAIDNETIIRNANNQLEVPIDEDTIYMDAHGFMKAKGGEGKTYSAGEHIVIDSENTISAEWPVIPEQKEYTGGNDIEVTSEGVINYTGSGGGESYTAGGGIEIIDWKDNAITLKPVYDYHSYYEWTEPAPSSRDWRYGCSQEDAAELYEELVKADYPGAQWTVGWDEGNNTHISIPVDYMSIEEDRGRIDFGLEQTHYFEGLEIHNGGVIWMALASSYQPVGGIIENLYISAKPGITQAELNTALESKQDTLTAGQNITIQNNVISATGGGKEYSAGQNIQISSEGVISATDTKYTASEGIIIENDYISVDPAVVPVQRTEHHYSAINFTVDFTGVTREDDKYQLTVSSTDLPSNFDDDIYYLTNGPRDMQVVFYTDQGVKILFTGGTLYYEEKSDETEWYGENYNLSIGITSLDTNYIFNISDTSGRLEPYSLGEVHFSCEDVRESYIQLNSDFNDSNLDGFVKLESGKIVPSSVANDMIYDSYDIWHSNLDVPTPVDNVYTLPLKIPYELKEVADRLAAANDISHIEINAAIWGVSGRMSDVYISDVWLRYRKLVFRPCDADWRCEFEYDEGNENYPTMKLIVGSDPAPTFQKGLFSMHAPAILSMHIAGNSYRFIAHK